MPTDSDVPSPVDVRAMPDALSWEQSAMSKQPFRAMIFERIATEIDGTLPTARILELGSGPGFLAEYLLRSLGRRSYCMLDFSPAMHELAQRRLQSKASHVTFIERDFRTPEWSNGLGLFDVVLTIQAVHELRHKRRAALLHAQVRQLLREKGVYLVCDHYSGEGGMSNDRLYMTPGEQSEALRLGGFSSVDQLLQIGSLSLFRAA